jgi:hypothetical protein
MGGVQMGKRQVTTDGRNPGPARPLVEQRNGPAPQLAAAAAVQSSLSEPMGQSRVVVALADCPHSVFGWSERVMHSQVLKYPRSPFDTLRTSGTFPFMVSLSNHQP